MFWKKYSEDDLNEMEKRLKYYNLLLGLLINNKYLIPCGIKFDEEKSTENDITYSEGIYKNANEEIIIGKYVENGEKYNISQRQLDDIEQMRAILKGQIRTAKKQLNKAKTREMGRERVDD